MRILFIITCLANIAFAFGSLPWMPNPVANHFAADGTPNGFMPPIADAILMSTIVGFIAFVLLGISFLFQLNLPSYCFNMPNRDYWLNEENRPKTMRILSLSIERIGVVTMLWMLYTQWEIFRANQTIPPKLHSEALYGSTILFVIIIIFEVVRLFLAFQMPKVP